MGVELGRSSQRVNDALYGKSKVWILNLTEPHFLSAAYIIVCLDFNNRYVYNIIICTLAQLVRDILCLELKSSISKVSWEITDQKKKL